MTAPPTHEGIKTVLHPVHRPRCRQARLHGAARLSRRWPTPSTTSGSTAGGQQIGWCRAARQQGMAVTGDLLARVGHRGQAGRGDRRGRHRRRTPRATSVAAAWWPPSPTPTATSSVCCRIRRAAGDQHGDDDRQTVDCASRRRQPRPDPRARRAGEQPQGRQRRDPQAPADGVHRRLRLGQELAGVRHDRRRVAAADQRDLQRVRAGLHADAGAARGRRARRADDRDHRRPGADGRRRRDPRSAPPPTPTRCCASCSAGSASRTSARRSAFSFNVALGHGAGADHRRARRPQDREERRSFSVIGGMCPRCEGRGSVTDFDLTALYDESKSLNEGALTIPGYSMDGWYGRIFTRLRLLRPRQADPQVHQAGAPRPALQGADQDQGRGHQPDLRGPDPADPEVDAVQGRRRAAAARPGLRRAGGDVHHLPRLRRHPAEPRRPARRRSTGISIADACAMQISDLAEWVRDLDEPSVAPLLDGAVAAPSTRSSRSGSATSRSTGRRARCRAARRSGPR